MGLRVAMREGTVQNIPRIVTIGGCNKLPLELGYSGMIAGNVCPVVSGAHVIVGVGLVHSVLVSSVGVVMIGGQRASRVVLS